MLPFETPGHRRHTESYEDLVVWQKGIDLVVSIYKLTRSFPSDERFGLVAQMRRAAVSVPSNIAEGQARHTTGEYVNSLSHSQGSLAELHTQLILAERLGYAQEEEFKSNHALLAEVRRMLNALRRSLSKRRN